MKLNLFSGNAVSGRVAALAATLLTGIIWLIVLTFPEFFIFNPLATEDTLFKIEQVFSTVGWVSLAVIPGLCSWFPRIRGKSTEPIFVFATCLWPASILAIQITMFSQGYGFYGYMASYPILLVTDLIAPAFLMLIRHTIFGDVGSTDK